MTNKTKLGIIIAVNALFFLSVVKYTRAQVRNADLFADSVVAANDTAHLVVLAALDDTINAYQRRIIQTEIARDSLDDELEARPVVRISAGFRVDTLRFTDTLFVAVETESGGHLFNWEAQDGPFSVSASATIELDWSSVFQARVFQVKPIQIGIRISCQAGDRSIQSASILMTAPDPLSLIPGELLQDPGVCNPPSPFLSFDFGFKNLALVGVASIGVWELLQFLSRR